MEGAKIHAENSIRQKNQSLNFLRMSARIDAVAQRVQTAVTMRQVTGSMAGVVKSMESAMKSMNLEKVNLFSCFDYDCIYCKDLTMMSSSVLTLIYQEFLSLYCKTDRAWCVN